MKKIRGPISIIICLSLILCGLQICSKKSIVKAYTSHTVDEAIAWAASKVGQSLEGDNYYGYNNSCAYQCVDFIICYYKYLGVAPSSGNGCDYATNALPSGWTRVQGGQPQRGDILVYSGNASNSAGHVAIYESDYSTYHQNFGGNRKVTHETYRYNGLTNAYWGYIRPDWTKVHNPIGCVDECESKEVGKLKIRGWAIDEDNYLSQLDIHVYIGPENNATGYNIGAANTNRPDVDNVYHCGQYHGFDTTINTDRTGWQRVRIFAINVGGGNNQLLYDNTVYINSDSEKPELISYDVTDLGEKGYTVSVHCSDNQGVASVKFPTKPTDGSADWVWYEGTSDNKGADEAWWNFTLSNGIDGKEYVTHVYIYDTSGNYTSFAIPSIKLGKDTEKPVIKSSRLYQENPGVVILKLDLSDNFGLGKLRRHQRYCYSKDANSGSIIHGYEQTVKQEDFWNQNSYNRPIVISKKNTELQETIDCNGIIGYWLAVSDLAGNKCGQDDTGFVWISGDEMCGAAENSEGITIEPGQTVKIGEITKWSCSTNKVKLDWNNERILKKTDADNAEDIEITGNEEGVEYIYFIGLKTGKMYSCRVVVKSEDSMENNPITSQDETSATPTPTPKLPSPTPTSQSVKEQQKSQKSNQSETSQATSGSSQLKLKKPKKVTSLKVVAVGKKRLGVSWKWFTEQDGFELQYALNKKFTKSKKTKKYNDLTNVVTLKKLKKKKNYYVRVRAYRKKDGKKVYGAWSVIKKAKVK